LRLMCSEPSPSFSPLTGFDSVSLICALGACESRLCRRHPPHAVPRHSRLPLLAPRRALLPCRWLGCAGWDSPHVGPTPSSRRLSPRRQPSSSLPTPRLDASPDSCPPQAGRLVVLAGTRPSRADSPRPPDSSPLSTAAPTAGRSAKRAGKRPFFFSAKARDGPGLGVDTVKHGPWRRAPQGGEEGQEGEEAQGRGLLLDKVLAVLNEACARRARERKSCLLAQTLCRKSSSRGKKPSTEYEEEEEEEAREEEPRLGARRTPSIVVDVNLLRSPEPTLSKMLPTPESYGLNALCLRLPRCMCEERRRRRRRRRRREEKFIHVYILLFRHAPIKCNTNPM